MFVSKFDDLKSILIFSGNKLLLWRCPKQCTVRERKPIDVLKDQSVLFASRDVGRPKKLAGEGGRKTMVSIICPHGLNRVKWFAKIWGGGLHPQAPSRVPTSLIRRNTLSWLEIDGFERYFRTINCIILTWCICHFFFKRENFFTCFLKLWIHFEQVLTTST